MSDNKKAINTEKAPKAIGPYSQAISSGTFLFISGQLPIDPGTGSIAEGGIEGQANQIFRNIAAILEAAGLKENHVVKTTIFLKSLSDFDTVNQLYSKFFTAPYPARSCFEVAALPKGAQIEIEAIAARD